MAKQSRMAAKRKHVPAAKTKNKREPIWMRVTKIVTVVVFTIIMLMSMVGAILHYRDFVNNKDTHSHSAK